MQCIPGCMVFDGGERKHHRDCPHYPESLTKIWHDCEIKLTNEIERLRNELDIYQRYTNRDVQAQVEEVLCREPS